MLLHIVTFPLLVCCVCISNDFVFLFFFNDTATTEIYTLSLHDALPISRHLPGIHAQKLKLHSHELLARYLLPRRSEEHTSELQSHSDLVCRLLLEKKKKINESDSPHKQAHIFRKAHDYSNQTYPHDHIC